jgi:endonuclease III
MTTPNRTAIINKLYKVLKKHFKPIEPPSDRPALEHLIYGCLLENARHEAADDAFAKLKELYFDWNEIRVTTVTELAEGMGGIPDSSGAAQRVKKSLQSIFEGSYSFDIEALKKQNIGKAEKDLEKVTGSTPFVRAYVTQNALGGHSIPVSKGAIDILHAVGILSDHEADKGQVPGLERAVPKNKGVEFGSLLQQLAADLVASPGSSKVKSILAEVDSGFKERLAARQARLEAQAAADAAAAKEARIKARDEARAAAAAAEAEAKAKSRGRGSKIAKPAPNKTAKPAADKTAKPAADKTAKPTADKTAKQGLERPAPPPEAAKARPKEKEKEILKPKLPMPLKKHNGDDSRRTATKGLAKKKPR